MKERPSDQIMRSIEKERQLSAQELELLEHSAAVDAGARAAEKELDDVRAALQALSGTSVHAEAEVLFVDLVSCSVPPHRATKETALALEQRRKAIAARREAVLAETAVTEARRERLATLSATVAAARERALGLAAHVAAAAPPPAALVATPASEPEASEPPVAEVPADAPAPPPPNGPSPAEAEAQLALRMKPRVHKRLKTARMVTLTSQAGTFVGLCRNLSVGGMFLSTYDKFLPEGTPVEVSLVLEGPPLRIPGLVRHVKKTGDGIGMGIDFGEASPEKALALYTFLNQQGAAFWEPEE